MTEPSLVKPQPRDLDRAPRGLPGWIAGGNFAIYFVWGAVPTVFLALQLQGIDAANKEANLALVSAVGALVALVAQPLWGAISDRTRSRFGRRAPLMVLGGLLGALSLIALGSANTVVTIMMAWIAVQLTINMAQGPLHAVIPDRIPQRLFGTMSALMGFGLMIGALGGQIFAASFASHLRSGYLIVAGVLALVMILFVVFNPEKSSRETTPPPFSLAGFLASFWVSPRKYPDFFWALTARLLLFLGYFGISGYQLYILSDYIGLGDDAPKMVPVLGLVGLVTAIMTMLVCGTWSDRVGRRKVFVLVSAVVMAVGFSIPFFLPTVTGMIISTAIAGLGFGCYTAVDMALITDVLPAHADSGKDLGVANIASAGPPVLAPVFAGVIVVGFGGYQPLYVIALIIGLIGAVAILPVKGVR